MIQQGSPEIYQFTKATRIDSRQITMDENLKCCTFLRLSFIPAFIAL